MEWFYVRWLWLTSKHVENTGLSASAEVLVLPAQRLLARYLLWKDGWLAGYHTPVLCQNSYTYLKTFWAPGSHIILVVWSLAPIPNSKGNPFSGGYKYTGWENLAIFDWNRRLSRKRCKIGRLLLLNVNRKSWVPDWMVSFSMTLSDP